MQLCCTVRMLFSTQCFFCSVECDEVQVCCRSSCSCLFRLLEPTSYLHAHDLQSKYWTSKILADSEILTDFTSRTWILAYSGLWTNELCLSLFTYPHYLKATVSIKLVQEYPHSHAHGGPKSIALKADLFLQLLGCLISFSLYEEKLGWSSWHYGKLKKFPKKCRKYAFPEYITEYTTKA